MSKEIKILSICFFIIFFAYNGVQQFLTSFFSDGGLLRAGFWVLVLIYSSLLVSNLFSGFIVSRLGAKKSLVLGSIFYSSFIFSLVINNLALIFSASVLLGFGAAILWTAQGTFLIRSSAQNSFGKNSGFFNTFFQFGTVAGIVVAGILITKIYFKNSFLFLGLLPLVACLLLTKLGKVVSRPVDLSQNFGSLKKLIKNPYFLKMGLIWFSFSLVLASVAGRFPLEIKEHFNLLSVGFILPIFYFLPIIFSYYFGKKSDIRGRNSFLASSLVLIATGFLLFAIREILSLGFFLFILSFLMVSFGYAIFAAIKFATLGDVSSPKNLEYVTALFTLFGNLGYVIIFLLNIYFPASFVYFTAFGIVLLSLIIIMPVLKLNMNVIKEKINS